MFTSPKKGVTTAAAMVRAQHREANLDRQEKNMAFPMFGFKGFFFRPSLNINDNITISLPLCPRLNKQGKPCGSPLSGESRSVLCEVCDGTFEMPYTAQDFRTKAHRAYEGYLNSSAEIISLDVPYDAIKAEKEDETRKIRIVWSQKDGRNQAVVYFIQKENISGEKAQVFVDIDRRETRSDASDIHPEKILAKLTAEFPTATTETVYRSEAEIKVDSEGE